MRSGRSPAPERISLRSEIAFSAMSAAMPRPLRTRRDDSPLRRRSHEKRRSPACARPRGVTLAGGGGGMGWAGGEGGSQPPPMQPAAKSVTKPRTPAGEQPAPAPSLGRRGLDLAYGAYQRGYYITAFSAATRRVEEMKD